ncbi:MAG TPA: DUF3619 family protein [Burkholderiaceae bacterium]|nr:DUF3619 family protein [Burkholderiaceae bacterium]
MNEKEFGYQIRQALNEAAARLDYKTTYRLEQARAAALARHREPATAPAWSPALQAAARSSGSGSRLGWFGRVGVAAPVLALVVGFIGIYQWQQQQAQEQRISDLAAMDFAVLMDETPIGAYADKGFGLLLRGETEDL